MNKKLFAVPILAALLSAGAALPTQAAPAPNLVTPSYGYVAPATCYPSIRRNPGTWMRASSWYEGSGKVVHFAIRESGGLNGTGYQWTKNLNTGMYIRRLSRYDSNPLEFYYRWPDHRKLAFQSKWYFFVAGYPLGETYCGLGNL